MLQKRLQSCWIGKSLFCVILYSTQDVLPASFPKKRGARGLVKRFRQTTGGLELALGECGASPQTAVRRLDHGFGSGGTRFAGHNGAQ